MTNTHPQVGVITPLPATDNTDISRKVNRLHKAATVATVKNNPEPLYPSYFGVEFGALAEFHDLPSTIRPRRDKRARKLCTVCHRHRSLFRYHGRVHFDSDHDLCFCCYRSAMNRLMATLLGE